MSFSLALLASVALAGDFRSLAERMRKAPNPAAAVRILQDDPSALDDPDISSEWVKVEAASATKADVERLASMVELRALTQEGPQAQAVEQQARTIKTSPLYKDAGVQETSSWLGSALARLKNLRLNWKLPESPRMQTGQSGHWIVVLMWGALGVAVLSLAFLAFRHFSWKGNLARRTKAVLEDDEPERSLDEWLQQADDLAARGAYREAVRALYLACLLRFDEHRVARFDRHETNWEHLGRIHSSARRPADLDFTGPTKAFDRIWYGKQVNGMEDVEEFRSFYTRITDLLRTKVAA